MEKTKNIYQKIVEVMKEVKYIQKSDKKVNGQYSFVTHDSVTAALHEPLANHGIVMIPSILDLHQDGNRTVAKMEISFVNADKPEDKITMIHYGYGIDAQDKGVGKAVSYAVKYALLKMFCLETGDDPEKDTIPYEAPKPKLTDEELLKKISERKKLILELAGDENKDDLNNYVLKIKKTYKSKKEEDIFFEKDAEAFVQDFFAWKEKSRAA